MRTERKSSVFFRVVPAKEGISNWRFGFIVISRTIASGLAADLDDSAFNQVDDAIGLCGDFVVMGHHHDRKVLFLA